jgi:hypothetical protein
LFFISQMGPGFSSLCQKKRQERRKE